MDLFIIGKYIIKTIHFSQYTVNQRQEATNRKKQGSPSGSSGEAAKFIHSIESVFPFLELFQKASSNREMYFLVPDEERLQKALADYSGKILETR